MVDRDGKHDLEDIYKALHQVMDERMLDGRTHMEHHKFVEYLIEKEEKRQARIEKFRLSAIGTAASLFVGALVWIGKIVADYFLTRG